MMRGNKKKLKEGATRRRGGGTQRRAQNAERRGLDFLQKSLYFIITPKPTSCEISYLFVEPDTTQGHSRNSNRDLSCRFVSRRSFTTIEILVNDG